MPTTTEATYLTVHEVADLLRLSPNTVYVFAHRGELPAFKIGGSFRIDRDLLVAQLEPKRSARTLRRIEEK